MKHDSSKSPKQFDLALGIEDQIWLSEKLHKQRQQKSKEKTKKQRNKTKTVDVISDFILKGIYRMDGDKLTYCVGALGEPRPVTFAVVKGSGQTLVKLQRFTTGEAAIETALAKLGARFHKDEVGYITAVNFRKAQLVDDDLKLLKELKKLTQVSLGDMAITDAGLLHLKDVKHLHDLHLNGTQITDSGLIHLKNHDLWTLYLTDTQITDAGLLHLRPFKKLYNLHLSRTRVTDDGMRTLQELPGLDSVFLEGTGITDAGVAHLVRIPKLSGVRLAGTKITDAAVKQLATLPKLGNVSLGGTQATDVSLGYLQNAKKLSFLSLTRPRARKRVIVEKTTVQRLLAGATPPLLLGKAADALAAKSNPSKTTKAERQFSIQAIRNLRQALPKLRIQSGR